LLPRRSITYANDDGYDLTVNHIAGGETASVIKRYRVDESNNLTLVDSTVQRGSSIHLNAAPPAPSVELVTISPLHGNHGTRGRADR
jgi:hypothetical protein